MNILVTGGCGYIGSVLVPHLLAQGHLVRVIDPQWFGDGFLPDNEHLEVIKGVITSDLNLSVFHTVIHLGGMTHDGSCQKRQGDAYSINVESFETLVRAAVDGKVRRFIFPSSVAAYGNTDQPVHEDHPLNPTTVYGGHKKACEEILNKAPGNMKKFILRPAGVFGSAPRMRFDLPVNQMTLFAVREGVIHVHGGEQVRSYVHIRDVVDVFLRLLKANLDSDTFNIVHSNSTILSVAEIVQLVTGAKIVVEPRQDDRSYWVYGTKLARKLSFIPKRGIVDAVKELVSKLEHGAYEDAPNDIYMNRV